MKILIFINSSWNVINFRSNLVKLLIDRGHEITILANSDEYTPALLELGCKFEKIEFDSRSVNPIMQIFLLIKLYVKIKKLAPEMLFTFTIKPNIFGSMIANYLKTPVVNNIAGLGIAHSNFFTRNLVKFLYIASLKHSKKCFFQNRDDLSYFLKNKIIDKSQVGLLPGSGVDVKHFTPTKRMLELRANSSSFNFLLSARMLWSKGIQEYVDAARIISSEFENCKFWLVGFVNVDNKDSISLSQINTWHKSGVIEFKGHTDNIKSTLAEVHCFVLPTYYPEGTPKSILEAGAMCLPVITTNSPGCRDAVEDGVTGFLCQRQNTADLVSKMRNVLSLSSEEVLSMGRSAQKLMRHKFDDNIVNNEYLNCINVI